MPSVTAGTISGMPAMRRRDNMCRAGGWIKRAANGSIRTGRHGIKITGAGGMATVPAGLLRMVRIISMVRYITLMRMGI